MSFNSLSDRKKLMVLTRFIGLGTILLCFCQNSFSVIRENEKSTVHFLMVYETMKPLELEQAVLYSSHLRRFTVDDSLVLSFRKNVTLPDTIKFNSLRKHSVYLKLILKFKDQKRVSNIFHYSAEKSIWDVFVGDNDLKINSKPAEDNFNSQNKLKGFVLILQTLLEMVMALLLSRIMGWPHLVVLMVLVANIAAYPLYLFSFDNVLLREVLVFFIKAIVMSLVGFRKMSVYKILALAIILMLIGFGFKEFLFSVAQII